MTSAGALRLATRGSRLARAQAALALAALGDEIAGAELVVIRSRGDEDQAAPVAELEGQGWFTSELERSLLGGLTDLAVHSAKDLPTQVPEGLAVVALLERADARDAAVTRDGRPLAELEAGARVGTSSPRRRALLAALYPALRPVPMRGNVDTRLRRMDEGEVDAVVVACAGLDRLDLGARIAERLDPRRFVPAPAQGAIALEGVAGSPASTAARRLDHPATSAAVTAERAVLRCLGGGCLLPLGAWARLEAEKLVITAALGDGEGLRSAELGGDPADPAALGAAVAERLR